MKTRLVTSLLGLALCGWLFVSTVAAQETKSFCAEVQMVIEQTLTLERQAFDAHMRIRNGIRTFSLDQVGIDVTIADVDGNPVQVTTDSHNTNALFYIRVDTMDNISNISGTGVVAPESTVDIHWLIIPSASAGGGTPSGVRYQVGANLRYSVNSDTQTVAVAPDTITVKPMPKLVLDYFLPYDVYGDDPFTPQLEAPVPFSLGVRVKNAGHGDAHALKIESGQPKIVENTKGLLIGFEITESEVQGLKSTNTLEVNFGTLATNRVKVARWTMECSLSGHFTAFAADFAHSDDLGGELTSLIQAVNTHTLLRNVMVDLPGRDRVRDFLAQDAGGLRVYESENYELAVTNYTAQSDWEHAGDTVEEYTYVLTSPPVNGPLYVKMPFDEGAGKILVRVIRGDGKGINLANAWIHKERERQEDPWKYFFCLFDAQGGGEYTAVFKRKPVTVNEAPVLQHIGRKVVRVGESLGFLVRATDPNETVPQITAVPLPAGATFTGGTGEGTFLWTPVATNYGVYLLRFTADDGEFADWEIVKVYVGHAGESLCGGIPCSLENWRVEIQDIQAQPTSGNATVRWDTVTGVTYDMYASDQNFGDGMVWSKIGATRLGTGARLDAADADLGTQKERRFYKVVVSGDSPDTNGVWGVIRSRVPAGYSMISPPLVMDRRFDAALGHALASALVGHSGGAGDGVGDEVYIMQENGTWRILYLDGTSVWRETTGVASTYELPEGQGFFIARNAATAAQVTFTGPVGNTGTNRTTIRPGWNILGLSQGKDLPLSDMLGDGIAHGGMYEEEADLLVLPNANGSWRRLMRVEGWGAPYDGQWFDLSTFQIYTNNLIPGAAYYYYRQPTAGPFDVSF